MKTVLIQWDSRLKLGCSFTQRHRTFHQHPCRLNIENYSSLSISWLNFFPINIFLQKKLASSPTLWYICECICQSNIMAFSNMHHHSIDLNTVVMAPWFTVLCANGTTTAPSTRWYFQRIFQKAWNKFHDLAVSAWGLECGVRWGKDVAEKNVGVLLTGVLCSTLTEHWALELLYSLSCCIQHTH